MVYGVYLGGISKHEAIAQALFLGPVGVALGASSVERVLFSGGFLEASRSRWTPLGQRLQGGAESEELGWREPKKPPQAAIGSCAFVGIV